MRRPGSKTDPPVAWMLLARKWWLLSPRQARRFWRGVCASRYARPRALRQQITALAVVKMDLRHAFLETLSPAVLVEALEDLTHEGLLARPEASQIESRLLRRADAQGAWHEEAGWY